jgi:hypothetical protein
MKKQIHRGSKRRPAFSQNQELDCAMRIFATIKTCSGKKNQNDFKRISSSTGWGGHSWRWDPRETGARTCCHKRTWAGNSERLGAPASAGQSDSGKTDASTKVWVPGPKSQADEKRRWGSQRLWLAARKTDAETCLKDEAERRPGLRARSENEEERDWVAKKPKLCSRGWILPTLRRSEWKNQDQIGRPKPERNPARVGSSQNRVANKRNGNEIGRENEDKALKLDWLKDPTTQEKTRAGILERGLRGRRKSERQKHKWKNRIWAPAQQDRRIDRQRNQDRHWGTRRTHSDLVKSRGKINSTLKMRKLIFLLKYSYWFFY